jgi:cell division protein FtsL
MAAPLRARLAPASQVAARPQLRVVSARRQVAWAALALIVIAAGMLMGATYLHTRLADRQLEIDQLDRQMRVAQEQFDELRAERAVLRSPTRLAGRASELGMRPGDESEFVPVDPMMLAIVIAQTGQLPTLDAITPGSYTRLDPLDQYRLVKSTSGEMP